MSFVLQIDFKFPGPYGDEMTKGFTELAESINEVPGFQKKVWTENEKIGEAGGLYFFDTEENAASYLDFHLKRLSGFGIQQANAKIFKVNAALSAINHFNF
ncbi:monooxygenase [Saccharibacillus sacchari]|uniref:monooxygenase n=1 Tax=Saccharibacillus sacchari TaxID=456493 RepID=UPI0004B0B395|nr:monooxygenase [Saccharibacillus sacchari]